MSTTSQRGSPAIATRQLQFRNQLWPKISDEALWHRKVSTGFTTIPRTMPLIMEIMDSLSNGKPVSSAYLDLWCRTFDDSFLVLNKHKEMAFHSGFSGQRAEQTWASRIKILVNLKFIDVKPGPTGDLSYAIIFNPYHVIKYHHEQNTPGMRSDIYHALLARSAEIGASDLNVNASSFSMPVPAPRKTRQPTTPKGS